MSDGEIRRRQLVAAEPQPQLKEAGNHERTQDADRPHQPIELPLHLVAKTSHLVPKAAGLAVDLCMEIRSELREARVHPLLG